MPLQVSFFDPCNRKQCYFFLRPINQITALTTVVNNIAMIRVLLNIIDVISRVILMLMLNVY